jgi:predicted  nucleic acid-binding Zn-ribbon protein
MKETGNPQYSEAISKAGEAYDQLQEALSQLRDLRAKLKTTTQKRLHTQNPQKLLDYKTEIDWLNQQILLVDARKETLALKIRESMEQHEKGQALMEEVKPKHLN